VQVVSICIPPRVSDDVEHSRRIDACVAMCVTSGIFVGSTFSDATFGVCQCIFGHPLDDG
jgi:hypothetical protein